MKSRILQIIRRFLPLFIIATTAYFFAKALEKNWGQLQNISIKPNALTIIGMILLILSVLNSGILWGKLLNILVPKQRIRTRDAIRIHCASWLLKYVPGQAGSYLNKLSWGAKKGYSKKALTNSFIYENALLLFASLLPTIPILLMALGNRFESNLGLFAPLLLVLPLTLIVNQNIFYKIVNALFMKLRRQSISKELFLTTGQIAKLQAEFMLPRILNGAGFVFITASLLSIEPYMWLPLGATYVLAGIIGMLAIFVPSGLGVREAVIVLFVSAYFTPAEAVLVSVLARFYATIADIGIFGVYLFLNKGKLEQK